MKITKNWLEKKDACREAIEWVMLQKDKEQISIAKQLIKENKLDWCNWLLPRIMNYKQAVRYAIYSAELCLKNWEKKYPKNKRPREAIEAAKRCLKNPTKKNKELVYSAGYSAANSAADSVAAYSAAYLAANSATRSAAYSANSAYSTHSASSAYSAYAAACSAASSAGDATLEKILRYGIKILFKEEK